MYSKAGSRYSTKMESRVALLKNTSAAHFHYQASFNVVVRRYYSG